RMGRARIGVMAVSSKKIAEQKLTRGPRDARLNLRLTAEQKRTIEAAAALAGRSLTDYVLTTVQERAGRAVQESGVIRLTDQQRDRFLEALDRTEARPLPGLRRAAKRHKHVIG